MEPHLHNGNDTPKIQTKDLLGFDFTLDVVTNENYCGLVENGIMGTTLAFGDVVYLKASDSRWELADASAVTTAGDVRLGIALNAGVDEAKVKVLLVGRINSSTFPSLTISAPLYLSETAGDITHTAPTTTDSVSRRLGFAVTSADMFFNPSNDYYIHV